MGIPYAVVGGMALFAQWTARFTEDVDILVTRDGLRAAHEKLSGLGYVEPFAKSKNLRDAETGVRIEFLITGHYPGDGKPKPVAFPDPAAISTEKDGIRYINLPALVELKLASGMSSPDRMKDLTDVQELVKLLRLPRDYAGTLNPYVQGKYQELWTAAHAVAKCFVCIWRDKCPAPGVKTIELLDSSVSRGGSQLGPRLGADG